MLSLSNRYVLFSFFVSFFAVEDVCCLWTNSTVDDRLPFFCVRFRPIILVFAPFLSSSFVGCLDWSDDFGACVLSLLLAISKRDSMSPARCSHGRRCRWGVSHVLCRLYVIVSLIFVVVGDLLIGFFVGSSLVEWFDSICIHHP